MVMELSICYNVRTLRVCCTGSLPYIGQSLTSTDTEITMYWSCRLNGGGKMVEQSAPAKLDPRQMLTPGSPISSRRESSPLPMGSQRSTRRRGKQLYGFSS